MIVILIENYLYLKVPECEVGLFRTLCVKLPDWSLGAVVERRLKVHP
jgi:hypothetical protein